MRFFIASLLFFFTSGIQNQGRMKPQHDWEWNGKISEEEMCGDVVPPKGTTKQYTQEITALLAGFCSIPKVNPLQVIS